MEASANFEIAVYASWGAAVAALLAVARLFPRLWPVPESISFEQPRSEVLWGLGAAIILFGISVATDAILKDWKHIPGTGRLVFLGQLIAVYSPIALLLAVRRQTLKTCFLRIDRLPSKIAIGLALSSGAAWVFFLVRGRGGEFPQFFQTLGRGGPVAMLQTFLEGVAIGFLLYRFGAWIGIGWSAVIVGVLFLAAHIPNYTGGTFHLALPVALLMAAAHAGISVLIFYGIWKSQDIIVFGFLHWFINSASDFTTA